MSDVSAIEWADATWNPVTGCSRVSPGCANCYIERTPPFRMAGRRFEIVGQESTTGVTLHADRLEKPLHWRKPRRVFVCSLADLFHDDVPDHFIAGVFAIMSQARQHTFQVLTKRPERARDLLCRWRDVAGLRVALPNVWLGVSIENARYTWRADVLREIPAAVRFISAEPLLDSLFPETFECPRCEGQRYDRGSCGLCANRGRLDDRGGRDRMPLDLAGIDWVIIGGESGPGARPFHLEHARELVDACREQDVAPFVKQFCAKPVERHDWTAIAGGLPVFTDEYPVYLRDSKGGDIDEWPADLQIREFPVSRARKREAVSATRGTES